MGWSLTEKKNKKKKKNQFSNSKESSSSKCTDSSVLGISFLTLMTHDQFPVVSLGNLGSVCGYTGI